MGDEARATRRHRAKRRRGKRRKGQGPVDEGDSLVVDLPGWKVSGRSVVLVFLLVGVAATVATLLMGVPRYWMIPAGFAVVVSGALFAETDLILTAIEGDPEASTVTVHRRGGPALILLRSALEEARVTSHTSSSSSGGGNSTSYGVALRKRDGGQLALSSTGGRRSDAEALAKDIDVLLEAVPLSEEREADLVRAAERRLRESPRVELSMVDVVGDGYRGRSQRVLEASWSLRLPVGRAATFPLAVGGLAIAVSGMVTAPPIAAGIALAVSALLGVGLYVRAATRSMRIRIDDEYLHICTVGSKNEDKALPLAGVDAIDMAWTGPLMVRVDEANEEIRKLMNDAEQGVSRGVGLFAIARGILALLRKTIHIDTGTLPFEERYDLEVVLGAEIASRTGRERGTL